MPILHVRVVPRAGRTAIAGMRGDALLVRLAAAPVDGAANDELIDLLSQRFAVPRPNVTIAGGHKSRHKRVVVEGLGPHELASRLSDILRTV